MSTSRTPTSPTPFATIESWPSEPPPPDAERPDPGIVTLKHLRLPSSTVERLDDVVMQPSTRYDPALDMVQVHGRAPALGVRLEDPPIMLRPPRPARDHERVERSSHSVGEGFRPPHCGVQFIPDGSPIAGNSTMPTTCIRGSDDRLVVPWQFQPWVYPASCVGVVSVIGTSFEGTGFMVGPRHVLTASHNLRCNALENEYYQMTFKPSFNEIPWFGEHRVIDYYVAAEVSNTAIDDFITSQTPPELVQLAIDLVLSLLGGPAVDFPPARALACDVAVLVLESNPGQPMIGELTGWFGFEPFDVAWSGIAALQHMGYPGSLLMSRPTYEGPIIATSVVTPPCDLPASGQALMHNGDVEGGQSGGPLWHWFSQAYATAVGLQSHACLTVGALRSVIEALPPGNPSRDFALTLLSTQDDATPLTGNWAAGGDVARQLIEEAWLDYPPA